MTQSHYSLRWNNHQTHILAAFDALLQAETLVDVTLVCAETSVRAHKVVLSACSPFFQRIFSENPCKHPVIVLKDFSGWEVQAIVDFMYKGEISVVQEQLQSLIKAAESLQVRGLASQDPFGEKDKEPARTPSSSPNEMLFERNFFGGRFPTPGVTLRTPGGERTTSPFSPGSSYEPAVKLPHMSRLSFPEGLMPRQECPSPQPRRKQARPRRRSGELGLGPQDLTKVSPPPAPLEEAIPENLCMKKEVSKDDEAKMLRGSPDTVGSPELDLSMGGVNSKEFRTSPPVHLPPTMNLKQEIESHSPLPFPPMPSVSALAMTPPHSKFFGLDSPLGLFPPGLDGCRNPLFDLTDPRTTPDPQMYAKKKMGRPKGQHSAPRGGPPRSWTNAELTEALQHVWNKKMTTSQASRIFGIPYNSLLMYVRGKYGKSLKLEQLRKDCIGGPPPPMDLLSLASGGPNTTNNNTILKGDEHHREPNTRPSSTEDGASAPPPPPVFNPFAHAFYPDFGAGYPMPVNMIHLLPQSEKSREQHYEGERVKKELQEEEELFRADADRRELVHQNGQD